MRGRRRGGARAAVPAAGAFAHDRGVAAVVGARAGLSLAFALARRPRHAVSCHAIAPRVLAVGVGVTAHDLAAQAVPARSASAGPGGHADPVLAEVVDRADDEPAGRIDALPANATHRHAARHATAWVLGTLAKHAGLAGGTLGVDTGAGDALSLHASPPRGARHAVTRRDARAVLAVAPGAAVHVGAGVALAGPPPANLPRSAPHLSASRRDALPQITHRVAGALHGGAWVAALTGAGVAHGPWRASGDPTGVGHANVLQAPLTQGALPMEAGLGALAVDAREAPRALGAVVDALVAVVILAVAHLDRRRAALTAGVAHPLVAVPVAVVVLAVADLERGDLGAQTVPPNPGHANLTPAGTLPQALPACP